MILNQYQLDAFRTCKVFEDDYTKNLAHMVMGMTSEQNELHSALDKEDYVNALEEIADIFWYIAGYCTFRNYKLQDIYNLPSTNIVDYINSISKLTDIVKKAMVYNKEIDIEKEMEYLNNICKNLNAMIDYINNEFDLKLDLITALTNNINKLKVRFPDKYSDDLANNRDLNKELEQLQQNII